MHQTTATPDVLAYINSLRPRLAIIDGRLNEIIATERQMVMKSPELDFLLKMVQEKKRLLTEFLITDVVNEKRKTLIEHYLNEIEVFLQLDVEGVKVKPAVANFDQGVNISLTGEPVTPPTGTVRYCLQSDVVGYMRFDMDTGGVNEDTAFQILASKDKPVFVDILHKINKNVWELKLYYPDGTIINQCYLFPNIFDSIKIYNMHLLFDGRFNS